MPLCERPLRAAARRRRVRVSWRLPARRLSRALRR